MSSESPAVVIFSIDGYEAEIKNYNPGGSEHGLIVRNIPSGTQNIAGTITANLGTVNGLALDTTLTSGTAKIQIYDGSNILGTTAHPVKTDPTGTTSQPITGTITANAGSGTFNIAAASLPLPSNAATETTLANVLTISTFTGRINTQGQKNMATSTPVVLASDQTVVPVSDNGGSLTIDGTVAATQSGTWTLQPGNTANTTPWLQTISQGGNAATVSGSGALKVDNSANTQPVSGTFWQATQPVSAASLPLPSGASTETTLAAIKAKTDNLDVALSTRAITGLTDTQLRATPVPVSGTITANAGSGTFAVSGTITSNIGTTNGLALDATLTNNTQTTRITDGTNAASVKAASTAAIASDKAVVVAISPNNTVAVTGTFWQATQPISGTITANAGSGTMAVSNTVLSVVGGGTEATAQRVTIANDSTGVLSIDDNGSSLTVDGTVTANAGSGTFAVSASSLPLPTGATTETTLSTRLADSTFTTRINTQGQKTMAASTPVVIASDQGAITVTGSISATNPSVATVAGSPPSSATYIGGSVTTGAPTYTTGQINPLSLTTAGALRIDGSGTTQPISGTISANQSGIWTVQPGNTANTTPWLTTISQGGNSATVSGSGALKVDGSAATQPVSGTFWQATQPISGTTTSNQGTANTAANGWFTRLTDGTTNVAVKAASTPADFADPGLVVSLNPASAQTRAANASVTSVASSASSVTLLAANSNRLGAIIVNDSTQILFVKFGSSASSSSFTAAVPISRGTYEVPFGYTGIITGVWNSVNGAARVTEITI